MRNAKITYLNEDGEIEGVEVVPMDNAKRMMTKNKAYPKNAWKDFDECGEFKLKTEEGVVHIIKTDEDSYEDEAYNFNESKAYYE